MIRTVLLQMVDTRCAKRDDVGSLRLHQTPFSAPLMKGRSPFQHWNRNHASRRFHQLR
jgi:hypothetical protein